MSSARARQRTGDRRGSETRKRVLMVGPSLASPGGMSAVAHTLMQAGLFEEWGVEYIETYRGPGLHRQLRVYSLALGRVLRELIRGKVELIHLHSASRGSFWRKSLIGLASRIFRVPYVFHVHSGEFGAFFYEDCGLIAKTWARFTLRNAALVISLTERWRGVLREIEPLARVRVLPNPIPVTDVIPEPSFAPPMVLFLGRLREKKGVFDLVRAIPQILAEMPETKFVIAGDGELASVRILARTVGAEHAVVTPGWLGGMDKQHIMSSATTLILPSYFEGLPICILEAMAIGLPVVATGVGGVPDIIKNNVTGLLVEPGDVDGIAHALLQVLRSRQLRNRLRAAAFDDVRTRFDSKRVCEQLSMLYEECGLSAQAG